MESGRAADSVGSLPPCGGGVGRGVAASSVLVVTPLPVPPPKGEGTLRHWPSRPHDLCKRKWLRRKKDVRIQIPSPDHGAAGGRPAGQARGGQAPRRRAHAHSHNEE